MTSIGILSESNGLLQTSSLFQTPSLGRTTVIIPTYNAGQYWTQLHASLVKEGFEGDQILVIDSSSQDETPDLVRACGCRFEQIPQKSFLHGATRQFAAELAPKADFLVFLTQDALPCGVAPLANLIQSFDDPKVGAAYGRQLPREKADPIERHARNFNYPEQSALRSFESRKTLGFRAAFFSNSFAAFRRDALLQVGGFPRDAIVSEEVSVAARMLMLGWKVAYKSTAQAVHSHPLTVRQEFVRYFDIGVQHGREEWLLREFGTASGEGRAFVLSQMRYLLRERPSMIPLAMFRNVSKWCSYQLGRREKYLSVSLKEMFSGQPNFWRDERTGASAHRARTPQRSS